MNKRVIRQKGKPLNLIELIAIAVGGMIGGGIFSILGISVEIIGNATVIAIAIGGVLAFVAAYSYAQLAIYYQDEGATYSFFKRTFPNSTLAASIIGWFVVFGYISTLALYAFTFSSYLSSVLPFEDGPGLRKIVAGLIIIIFMIINLVSVKGMGKIEDLLVYTKIIILLVISGFFIGKSDNSIINFPLFETDSSLILIFIVASITFVAFEGFQLTIHAFEEAENPKINVPRAIYISIFITLCLYLLLAFGSILTIPKQLMIQDKEYALASGATSILGPIGLSIIIAGALLATSSAINATLFGASRLMAIIARDGYFPLILSKRLKGHIPHYSIIVMGLTSYLFILTGSLESILEFGSITFIFISFLMAFANFKIHRKTNTKPGVAIVAMIILFFACVSIIYYEIVHDLKKVVYILSIYFLLLIAAWIYHKINKSKTIQQ